MCLKDPCSEFSKVIILYDQPIEGHFWSPRSRQEKKIFFFLIEIDLQKFSEQTGRAKHYRSAKFLSILQNFLLKNEHKN